MSESDKTSNGKRDDRDDNPFEIGASIEQPASLPTRKLSVNEQLGAIISAFLAAGASFFGTCPGGMIVGDSVSRFARGPGALDGALELGLAVALMVGVPLIVSMIVFRAVIRAMRKPRQ